MDKLPKVLLTYINEFLPLYEQVMFAQTSKKTRFLYNIYYKLWFYEYRLNIYTFDNLKFVQYLVEHHHFDGWLYALNRARESGNKECIEYLSAKLENELNQRKTTNIDVVHQMIAKGVTNWNWGLLEEYNRGHLECIQLMIAKGVDWDNRHGRDELPPLEPYVEPDERDESDGEPDEHGEHDEHDESDGEPDDNYINSINQMIAQGAIDWNYYDESDGEEDDI